MKKGIRPFIIEYRAKRGRSRLHRGGASFRCADQSANRMALGKDARNAPSAWQALFKQEDRLP